MTNSMEAGDRPDRHLLPFWGDRGFLFMPAVPSSYGGHVQVSESSNAAVPAIWLRALAPTNLNDPDGPATRVAIHLPVGAAEDLVEQLLLLLRWHYQLADPDERERMMRTDWAGGETRRG